MAHTVQYYLNTCHIIFELFQVQILHENIDQTLMNSLHGLSIVWEHWPGTHEFITRSAELWNRWIRV